MDGYDVAQVCLNGHSANSSSISMPQFNMDFCDQCGEKTISSCPGCNTPIRGTYQGSLSISTYQPPAYCYKCGKAFPWTERKIEAAVELVSDEGGLTGAETVQFKDAIKDIVTESPRTQVGAARFKRMMAKVGRETASAVRDILVDITSETAKKAIWG